MTRHVPFSPDPRAARVLAREGLAELASEASELAARPEAPQQLRQAARSFEALGSAVSAETISA